MKKISIILFLFCSAVLVSCEEDLIVFDNENGQSYLQFPVATADLPVPREGQETISVPISVSTISDTDRTVMISVVEEESTLGAANYTFTDAVIPAGSYTGAFQVTGTNASLVIGEVETVTFQIDGFESGDFNVDAGESVTVRAFISCPLDPQEFVGTYSANDGSYEVDVTYDEAADLFKFENLYNAGGVTYINFSYENSIASVDFVQDRATNFGVLYVHPSLGNVYAVNPSVASGNAGDNKSTFRTCDQFIELFFRRQIQDGRFFSGTAQVSLTKMNETETDTDSE